MKRAPNPAKNTPSPMGLPQNSAVQVSSRPTLLSSERSAGRSLLPTRRARRQQPTHGEPFNRIPRRQMKGGTGIREVYTRNMTWSTLQLLQTGTRIGQPRLNTVECEVGVHPGRRARISRRWQEPLRGAGRRRVRVFIKTDATPARNRGYTSSGAGNTRSRRAGSSVEARRVQYHERNRNISQSTRRRPLLLRPARCPHGDDPGRTGSSAGNRAGQEP